jgi:hypothetical protein
MTKKKSSKNKRLVILCSICGTAALSLSLVSASLPVPGGDEQSLPQIREIKVTEDAIRIPDISEEAREEKNAPASSAAISPDSNEQITVDF